MSVEVVVDELVLRGVAPEQAPVVAAALEARLGELAGGTAPPAGRDEAFRSLPAVRAGSRRGSARPWPARCGPRSAAEVGGEHHVRSGSRAVQHAPVRRVSQAGRPRRAAGRARGGRRRSRRERGRAGRSPPCRSRRRRTAPVRRCAGPGLCDCPRCRGRADAVIGGQGAPLEAAPRRFMEARFGRDFGSVRVHADDRAAASARALGARAYAVGEHVVSAEGPPSAASEPGRRLLAHELAHVVQQRDGAPAGVVRRQAAQPGPAPASAPTPAPRPQRDERLNLGRGGSRVDAELDRADSRLTVKMKVLFNFVNVPRPWPSPARQIAWRDAFVSAVQRRWSYKHFLVPMQACPGEPQQLAVRMQVLPVTSNPHFTMTIGFTDRFRTSFVQGRTATMDVLDVAERDDQPQTPVEHEFGHMLGLPHIHCDRNDDQCYGTTSEERADVMGQGSYVSPRDYEPFSELMPYFTGCNWRVQQASFVPTSRGPVLGGFLGGLLGLAGGIAAGFALGGPIGALIGGAIGLLGGAAFGAWLGTPRVPS